MRTEYHALRRVGALAVQESNLNANILRIITDHQNMFSSNLGEQIGETMQANFTRALSVLKETTDRTSNEENVDPRQNTINNQTSPEKSMMKIIQQMQSKMDALTTQLGNINAPPLPRAYAIKVRPLELFQPLI